MKKINVLIVLGFFVVLVGVAQPAQAGVMGGNWIDPLMFSGNYQSSGSIIKEAAHLNAALGKFEGLLNAYATSQVRGDIPHHPDFIWIPYQGDRNHRSAVNDLSNSLEQFNTALLEVYPTMAEEGQLAVRAAYSSLGFYLENLAAETNSVFSREVLIIEHEESDKEPLWLWSVNAWTLPDNA